ncbi:MAG TPA: glycosyltransferase [bacterium]|nr:glycosyltransferase [bacterium]
MIARAVHVLDTGAMGGTEAALVHLVRHLDPNRFRPSAILSPDALHLPLVEQLRDAGIEVHFQTMPRTKRDVRRFAGLIGCLRRMSADVVHVHLPFTLDNRWAFLAARLAGTRVVVSTEQLAAEEWVFRPIRARVLKRVLVALQDRVIATSEHVRARLAAAGVPSAKLMTVYNPVEIPEQMSPEIRARVRRHLGIAADTPLVGMVARIDPKQKRYDQYLAAASRVATSVPSARFLVVGDGAPEARAELERTAHALGLAPRVRFLGYRADARDIVAALDVFVLASDNEGFPLVTLEAMAAEVPIVATDLPSLREQIADTQTGYLVPRGDVETLAGRVTTLLQDRDRARDLASRARAAVRQFDARSMAARIQDAYDSLLAGRKAARHTPHDCSSAW